MIAWYVCAEPSEETKTESQQVVPNEAVENASFAAGFGMN
jgi:hypothetical protein